MDSKEEYQDPDYQESSTGCKKPAPVLSEEEHIEKIRAIIRREFANEIEVREKEVLTIDQRLTTARRILHRLRYALVNNYYKQERLQLSSGQLQDDLDALAQVQAKPELSNLLREGQRRIHPSVRKLLGKGNVDLDEIFKTREPRNKIRKDYYAMVKSKNVTTPADSTTSLRPVAETEVHIHPDPSTSRPKKVPRHMDPKIVNVCTLDEATRNKMKHRYRIIIGNTSKYAPPASRADRSTHKWLLYIRGPPHQPDISRIVTAVTVRLHHSYAPHHTVHLQMIVISNPPLSHYWGSTHKWLLYIRGPPHQPDISRIVTAVTVRLHHSYAPHHTVHLHKAPFHVSRRGWGEFPAKIELHFELPSRNRPATVEHTIKLDRNYTGLQTLGAETILDVWLHSTEEMLEYEYTENASTDTNTQHDSDTKTQDTAINTELDGHVNLDTIKQEVEDECNEIDNTDSWMDFFTNNSTEVNVDEMLVKTHNIQTMNDEQTVNINNESNLDETKTDLESRGIKVTNDVDDIDSNKTDITKLPYEIVNQTGLENKRIVKYIEPNTGKIYYLEMDRQLDLSKVQEIIIESEHGVKTAKISPMKSNGLRNVRRKKMESLLKPDLINTKERDSLNANLDMNNFKHIKNDHCYISSRDLDDEEDRRDVIHGIAEESIEESVEESTEEAKLLDIREKVYRLTNARMVVDYMLRKIPIISSEALKPNYAKEFPFVVENEERYWKLDFAKRRNIEWSRAKLINKTLQERFGSHEKVWRTKQILIYSRLHGFNPIRTESIHTQTDTHTEQWSSWNDPECSRKFETNIKEVYPNPSDISTLSVFNSSDLLPYMNSDLVDLTDCEEDIDVTGVNSEVRPVLPVARDVSDLTVLPVEDVEDRLRFLYIEKKCADIGIELRNEDVGNGFSYSAVHAVILSAVKNFAEELIRSALAAKLSERRDLEYLPSVWVGSSSRSVIALEHVYAGTRNGRLQTLGSRSLAAPRTDTSAPL